MSAIRGVVVGHGRLASAMTDAVQRIVGSDTGLVAVSNEGCDRNQIEERLTAAIGEDEAILFIDMPSGSCLFAAMRQLRDRPGVRMVTGVNLAMLIEFAFNRDGELDAVAGLVAEAGRRAVGVRG